MFYPENSIQIEKNVMQMNYNGSSFLGIPSKGSKIPNL